MFSYKLTYDHLLMNLTNASTHQFYSISVITCICQKPFLAFNFVNWRELGSLVNIGKFGEFSKFGKGRLDYFIYIKYVLLYIKQPNLYALQNLPNLSNAMT